jgi:homoserine kinase
MDEVTVFCPATVANVSCGFDVMGFCLEGVGDEMIIRKTKALGLKITKIEGADLPFEIEQNVAGVSAKALYDSLKPSCGFEIEIYKKIKPGSGIGSSSASAVGSVFGMNELLGKPYRYKELISFAIQGEALASKCEHADNLAPCLYGGFTLVRSIHLVDILQLPTPSDLYATIIHPQIEIKTADARAILPQQVALQNAITQWSNMGSFVHALHTSDYELIGSALKDVVVEPHRKQLIPHFEDIQTSALQQGALGCGISGSGPSVFALSKGETTAKMVQQSMDAIYSKTDIPFYTFVSKVNTDGAIIIKS